MKCLFCNSELRVGADPNNFICPTCDSHIYMKSRCLIPGNHSPHYIRSSYNLLKFIYETKPDLVLASADLFSPSFELESVYCYYKKRSEVAMLNTKMCHVVYYTNEVTPDVAARSLIACNGVLAFEFKQFLASCIVSCNEFNKFPLLRIYAAQPDRLLWQLFLSHNMEDLNTSIVDSACSRVPMYAGEVLSDQQAAFMASMLVDSRFKRYVRTTTWEDAIIKYQEETRFASGEEYNKVLTETINALPNKGAELQFSEYLVTTYVLANPQLAAINDDPTKAVYLNADSQNGFDDEIFTILGSGSCGSVYFMVTGQCTAYAWLTNLLFGDIGTLKFLLPAQEYARVAT